MLIQEEANCFFPQMILGEKKLATLKPNHHTVRLSLTHQWELINTSRDTIDTQAYCTGYKIMFGLNPQTSLPKWSTVAVLEEEGLEKIYTVGSVIICHKLKVQSRRGTVVI